MSEFRAVQNYWGLIEVNCEYRDASCRVYIGVITYSLLTPTKQESCNRPCACVLIMLRDLAVGVKHATLAKQHAFSNRTTCT